MHIGEKLLAFSRKHFKSLDFSKNNNKKWMKGNLAPPVETNPSSDGVRLLDLPTNLLIHRIFSHLNVRDICRLKQVCHRADAICTANAAVLPRRHAKLVLIRAGHWLDVLEGRRTGSARKVNDALCKIEFTMPKIGGIGREKQRSLSYRQLIQHFEFELAFVDVQLLNMDMLERLQLNRLMASQLVVDFSSCPGWPIRRYSKEILENLCLREFPAKIDLIFPNKYEATVEDEETKNFADNKRIDFH